MKQIVQNMRSGETLVIETPVPRPSEGQLLVRTAASLVSAGTERMVVGFAGKSLLGKARSRPDLVRQVVEKARREGVLPALEASFNRLDQPLLLGYSSAGTIAGLGAGVTGFKPGQRVACAGGGYAVHAEYAVVPFRLVAPLPEEVDFESAAFTTLGSIALHGYRLAEVQIGARLAVIGLGLLGMLAASIARAAGCHVLGVDLDPERVEFAGRLGVQAVRREGAESAAAGFSRSRGCDAVLICADTSSDDTVELAGKIACDRARVIAIGAVGQNIPRKIFYEKELTFLNSRSYGPGRYDPSYEEKGHDYPPGYVRWTEGRNLEAFVDLLASGSLDVLPLITHRFPIEQALEAYRLILGKPAADFLGVLLTYPGGDKEITGASEDVSPVSRVEISTSPPLLQSASADAGVRLGVLGAGNFATAVMLPAVRKIPGLELVGVVSATGTSAHHAAQRFGFRYAASDADEVLQDSQINTIAIMTRHHKHASQVVAALAAGKHVFCEKPLALTQEELDGIEIRLREIGQAQREVPAFRPPLLTIGFNRRFAPFAVRLREFIGECHEPIFCAYRVNAGYLPIQHWTQDPHQGGGRLLGEVCHFVDFLVFLAGEVPRTVWVYGLPDLGRYREDNLLLGFEFPDGSLGTISYLANGDRSFGKERVEVFCAGRVGVLDDFRRLELVSGSRRRVYRSTLRQDKGHRTEWQAFVSAIQAGGPPPIPYTQLLGVTRSMLVAQKSLREGRKLEITAGEWDDRQRI